MPTITFRTQAPQQLVAADLSNTNSIVSAINQLASEQNTKEGLDDIILLLRQIHEGAVLQDLIVDTRTPGA